MYSDLTTGCTVEESRFGSQIFKTGPEAHPISYLVGTEGAFPGLKRPDLKLTTHIYVRGG
jgi:hypothetical protein